MSVSFTWSATRVGNIGYVEETRPDGTRDIKEMPFYLVEAYVEARRKFVRMMMEKMGAKRTHVARGVDEDGEPDWETLQ